MGDEILVLSPQVTERERGDITVLFSFFKSVFASTVSSLLHAGFL